MRHSHTPRAARRVGMSVAIVWAQRAFSRDTSRLYRPTVAAIGRRARMGARYPSSGSPIHGRSSRVRRRQRGYWLPVWGSDEPTARATSAALEYPRARHSSRTHIAPDSHRVARTATPIRAAGLRIGEVGRAQATAPMRCIAARLVWRRQSRPSWGEEGRLGIARTIKGKRTQSARLAG